MRRRAPVLVALAVACGDPSGPIRPDRTVVGPPPEAAQPELCLPPFPMQLGNGYVLLADLDRGEACFAYLERDECVLGIFEDCTDARPVPRQWRGRVDLDVDGATTVLQTIDDADRNPTVLPRDPVCCEGAVQAPDTDPWAMLECRLVRCGNENDVQHVGLYLDRYDPDLDPAAAVGPDIALPSAAVDLAATADAVWAVTPTQLLRIEGGAPALAAELTEGRAVAAWAGAVHVIDGARLWSRASGAMDFVPVDLPAPAARLAAGEAGAVVDLGDGQLWTYAAGTFTGTVALPGELVDLASAARPRLAIARDPVIRSLQPDLTLGLVYDTARNPRRTGTAVFPTALARGPTVSERGATFAARCHGEARKTHCIFESDDPDVEAVRFGLAGVESIRAVHLDAAADRWITVGERGQITAIDRATGRPRLQHQVRLDLDPRASAVRGRRLYVADADAARLVQVDLSAFD